MRLKFWCGRINIVVRLRSTTESETVWNDVVASHCYLHCSIKVVGECDSFGIVGVRLHRSENSRHVIKGFAMLPRQYVVRDCCCLINDALL